MIKNYLLLSILIASFQMFSQEVYLNAGKNFTDFSYKNAFGQSNPNLQSGTGNFYEVGLTKPFENNKLLYSFGLSLNEYNAVGSNSASSYRWDTKYLGITGGVSYVVFQNKTNIGFLLNFGLKAATIIYGKQEIDGSYYDLVHQKEFSGIMLEPSMGFQLKYRIPSFGSLSLGYNFCKSLNLSNSSAEKLSFSTNQIQLGFHFPIN